MLNVDFRPALRVLGRHVSRQVFLILAHAIRFHLGSGAAPRCARIGRKCGGPKKCFCLRVAGRNAFLAAQGVPGIGKCYRPAVGGQILYKTSFFSPLALREKTQKNSHHFMVLGPHPVRSAPPPQKPAAASLSLSLSLFLFRLPAVHLGKCSRTTGMRDAGLFLPRRKLFFRVSGFRQIL